MDRNRLKGVEGDRIDTILSAAGINFRKLLGWAADLLRFLFSLTVETFENLDPPFIIAYEPIFSNS